MVEKMVNLVETFGSKDLELLMEISLSTSTKRKLNLVESILVVSQTVLY